MSFKQPSYNKKSIAPSGVVLLIVLLAVSVVCASVYGREGQSGPLHNVQNVAGMVASPVQFLGVGVAFAEEAAGDAIENATADNASYTALQEENAQLKSQLVQAEEYRLEAQRLQGLLDLSDQYGLEGVTGRVIGRNPDSWDRVVTVDVGSNKGVELGLPVMGSSGLIGQVIEVSPLTSKVRLIDDPQSGVAVYIQSSRAEGVVKGSVDGLLYLEYVDSSVEVNVGDVLVTSGIGGSYLRGMQLGTVSAVRSSAGTSDRTIIVAPLAAADPLEEVTVVTSVGAPMDEGSNADGSSSSESAQDGAASDESDGE